MIRILIILATLALYSCGGSQVTRKNAENVCYLYEVKCDIGLNGEPDYPVVYTDWAELAIICESHTARGCIVNKTIHMGKPDWWVLGHERCHNYCNYPTHIKKRHINRRVGRDWKAK